MHLDGRPLSEISISLLLRRAIIVAGLLATTGTLAAGVTDDTILIGMEGDARSFAVDEENRGMRVVMREVNRAGGVHGRRLVEVSYGRPRENAIAAQIDNVRRLVEDDGVFLLFNFGGPGSVSIKPYAVEQGVPYLFPHTALIAADGAREVFTSYPRYDGETRVMFTHLAEEAGAERIGVIYADNVYGRYFAGRARELAGQLGFEIVRAETLPRFPDTATPQMEKLRQAGADTVVMALYPAGGRAVLEAKGALDWDVRLVSSGPLTDERYFLPVGDVAAGTLGFCHYPNPAESMAPGIVEYRRLMRQHFPGVELNRYSLYGYVMGRLVVEGIERAGRELTRDAFISAMESIRDWDSGGIMPPASFSADDHHAQSAGFICRYEDGAFRALTDWIEPLAD